MTDGRAAIQRDLDRLEMSSKNNLMKLIKGKYKVLGSNKPIHQFMLGASKLEKQARRKRHMGPAEQVFHEPAMCPCQEISQNSHGLN